MHAWHSYFPHTLTCCWSVALILGILAEGVRHTDGAVAEKLAVHSLNGCVGGLEARIIDKGKALKRRNLTLDTTRVREWMCVSESERVRELECVNIEVHMCVRENRSGGRSFQFAISITFEFPVSVSRMILGGWRMTPKALKVSYRSFSSTSGSRLPTKIFAPTTSGFFVCEEAWKMLVSRGRRDRRRKIPDGQKWSQTKKEIKNARAFIHVRLWAK